MGREAEMLGVFKLIMRCFEGNSYVHKEVGSWEVASVLVDEEFGC